MAAVALFPPLCFSSLRRSSYTRPLRGENSGGKPVPAESGAPVSAVRTADDDGGQGQAGGEATSLNFRLRLLEWKIKGVFALRQVQW